MSRPAYPAPSQPEVEHLRWAAATQIIDAMIGTRVIGLNGRQITVMYSDSGTESMKYAPAASSFAGVPGTLKKGDGKVGSACRGSG